MEDMARIIREEVDREDECGETLQISSDVRGHPNRCQHDARVSAEDQTPRDLPDFSPPASGASEPSTTPSQWVTKKISQTFFAGPYLGLRANGLALSRSSLRSLSKLSPTICLSGVMNFVRNIEEEEGQGIAAIDDPVPRDRASCRKTAGRISGSGMVSITALHGRAGVTVSLPPRTLGHLMGRSARGDLGADEKCATSENMQRRYLTTEPGLIGFGSANKANDR